MLLLMDELEETYVEHEPPQIDFEIKEVEENTSSCLENSTPTFDEPDVPRQLGRARQDNVQKDC